MKLSESSTVLSDDNAKSADYVDITDISNWIVHNGNQFSPELVLVLTHAYDEAQKRSSEAKDCLITEKDLIQCMICDPVWPVFVGMGLPSADRVNQRLSELMHRGNINENGAVSLSSLTPEAQRIVTIAHILAQKKGVFPINNRIMLASFLIDKDGYAAKACNALEVQPEDLFALMVLVTEDTQPRSFGLSIEACGRIITPVLDEAKRIASDKDLITEQELFKAFCIKADNGFKEFLKQFPMGLDLDKLKGIDFVRNAAGHKADEDQKPCPSPSGSLGLSTSIEGEKKSEGKIGYYNRDLFDDTAWRILIESARIACLQGTKLIRTPHLCAGMIGDGSTRIGTAIKLKGFNPDKIKEALLSLIPVKAAPIEHDEMPEFGENADHVIKLAMDIARSKNAIKVGEEHIFTALFADGGGIVGEVLRKLGIKVGG